MKRNTTAAAIISLSLLAAGGCRSKREMAEVRTHTAGKTSIEASATGAMETSASSTTSKESESVSVEYHFFPPDSSGRTSIRKIAVSRTVSSGWKKAETAGAARRTDTLRAVTRTETTANSDTTKAAYPGFWAQTAAAIAALIALLLIIRTIKRMS